MDWQPAGLPGLRIERLRSERKYPSEYGSSGKASYGRGKGSSED